MLSRSTETLESLGSTFLNLIATATVAELDAFLEQLKASNDLEPLLRAYENKAFYRAALHNQSVIPILLKHGADPIAEDAYGSNALTYLLNQEKVNIDIAISLIAKGVYPNTQNSQGHTLWYQVAKTKPQQIPLLLSKMRSALDECKSKIPIACKTGTGEISYDRTDVAGQGTYSTVFKGQLLKSFVVALKRIPFTHQKLEFSEREKHILQKLTEMGAKNIVGFYGYTISDNAYCLIMEFCPGFSLYHQIKITSKPTDEKCIGLMCDITTGLTYLHKIKFVHRDLRSTNVLIDLEGCAKLCDFGKSDVVDSNNRYETILCYVAPELQAGEHNTEKTDIWSLVFIFWEIAAWRRHYVDIKQAYIDQKRATFPPNIAKLITWGWATKPAERPTADELLTHLNTLKS